MKRFFKNKTSNAELDFVRASLEEGLKCARGEKANVRVEFLMVRIRPKHTKRKRLN